MPHGIHGHRLNQYLFSNPAVAEIEGLIMHSITSNSK